MPAITLSTHDHDSVYAKASSTTYNFSAGLTINGTKSVNLYGTSFTCGLGCLVANTPASPVSGANLYSVGSATVGTWSHNTSSVSGAIGTGSIVYNLAANYSYVGYSSTTTNYTSAFNNVVEFAVGGLGAVYGGTTYTTLAADYAEFFEWHDGNLDNEDRVGYCVVLEGNKIRKWQSSDTIDSIIGVISGTASVIGNSCEHYWSKRFLLDDFGRRIPELVEIAVWKTQTTDDTGKVQELEHSIEVREAVVQNIELPAHTTYRTVEKFKINPDWDPTREYEGRDKRKEWGIVGLLGQIWIRKDQPIKTSWLALKENASATLHLVR